MTARARPAGRGPSPLTLAILVSLSIGGLMSSDINLPGIALTAASLDVPVSAVQASFGPYLVGLLVAQVIYGPLSDAHGRRVPILVGFSVYALSSLACAFAADIMVFTLARLLQALGAGAGLVVARAVIGDLYDRETATRVLGLIMPWMGSSPAFAPIIGGYLTEWFSWRAPFLFTSGLAALTVVAVLFRLPESRPATARTRHLAQTVGNYRRLLGSPVYWRYGANLAAGYAVYTGYLVGSPVIFQKLGVGVAENGYCYVLMSVAFITGNLVSRRLVRHTPVDTLLARAHLVFAGGSLAFLLFSVHSPLNLWPMLILMAVVNVGNGFVFPLSVAGGVTAFPAFPGAAAGLLGACQMGGGIAAALVVSAGPEDSLSMSVFVTACVAAGAAAFLACRRRTDAAAADAAAADVTGSGAAAGRRGAGVAEGAQGAQA